MKLNVLATSHEWVPGIAERLARRTGTPFVLVTSKDELTAEKVESLAPARAFSLTGRIGFQTRSTRPTSV